MTTVSRQPSRTSWTPAALSMLALIVALASATDVAALPRSAVASPAPPPDPSRVVHVEQTIDGNQDAAFVTNQGSWAFDMQHGEAGFEWPIDSSKTLVFASGLWLGARVNGGVQVSVAEYSQEYAAGPLDDDGNPLDPGEGDPFHHVYKIREGDGLSNPEYRFWPIEYGAPVDSVGLPLIMGAQSLWCVYNDGVAAKHTNAAGMSDPLGVEVRQYVYAFDDAGALDKTIFLDFEIENKGQNLLEDMYVSFWFDPDLGDPGDDLVGCDTTLHLGYCYNATNDDAQYGSHPPAIGCKLLLGPTSGGEPLGMTAFNMLRNGTDPQSAVESYNIMQGLQADGSPQLCDGEPTRHAPSGDPVAGTSCLDSSPADRRFMMSSGPFTMVPDDVQHVVIAIIVGGEYEHGDRLSNVSLLRFYGQVVQERFDAGFSPQLPNQPPTCSIVAPDLGTAGEPVQFDGTGSHDPDGVIVSYAWEFGDGGESSLPAPVHTYDTGGQYQVTLRVTDDAGETCILFHWISIYESTGIEPFIDATNTGVSSIEYLDIDETHRRALSWVNWGGRYFNGAFDTGCRWSGSLITGEQEELGPDLCPDATLAPERFDTVELRFDGTQQGYRYLRRDVSVPGEPAGPAPDNGRGYLYAGYDEVQCTAWKIGPDSETRLQVMYTERLRTDWAGDPLPPEQQPESQDALWAPTPASDGGREYLTILDEPYSETPLPAYMVDGIYLEGAFPALYGGWLRLRGLTDIIDPADRFVVFWSKFGDAGEAAGVGWSDVDGDGDLDLYLANVSGTSRIFANQGDGTFNEIRDTLLSDAGNAAGFAWGDVDNDHDPDLYLAHVDADNRLLRNDGDFEFVDVTGGLLAGAGNSVDVSWTDHDLDSDLDLFLVNTDAANRLLRNDGNAAFVDITSGPLLEDPGASRDAAWADFDADGDPDLYLTNTGANRLLRNDGGGVFVDVTTGPLGDATTGAAAAWGDYDNDLDPDLYVANDGPDLLLRNDGGGTFTDVTVPPINDSAPARAVSWVDIDQDADLDLYVVNHAGGNRVYENQGDGTFIPADIRALREVDGGVDAAWADYDQDGDVDVYLANDGPNLLLRNERELTRWLHVDLLGESSNVFGVGTRLRVVAGGIEQRREVSISDGNSLTAEFGLGAATTVELVEARWPSGVVQTFVDQDIDQRLLLDESIVSAVELTGFEAVGEVGRVVLRWVTGGETDHAGFNVWRRIESPRPPANADPAGAGAEAEYERLHEELLGGRSPYVFIDVTAEPDRPYLYRLEAVDRGGASQFFGPVRGVALARPLTLALGQNVPNPFNPSTAIGFELPRPADVRLAIYDVTGRVVRVLADNRREPGVYQVYWDGRDALGRTVGSGLYLYRLEVGDWSQTRKMLLVH